jgi:hypothetical protein
MKDQPPNGPALGFPDVLSAELDRIRLSRKQRIGAEHPGSRNEPLGENASPQERAFHENLIGLAFSGGGIRSATFNLGILQGLAKYGILPAVDYLSTVSGGGYIGSWLHAWIRREDPEEGKTGRPGILTVTEALAIGQEDRREAEIPTERTVDPPPEPVQFLRRYSNYLTPRTGLLSTDTWTMISIWFRNTLLNQIILFLALAAMLMLPRALYWVAQQAHDRAFSPFWNLLPVGVAVFIIGLNLSAFAPTHTWFARAMDRIGIDVFKRETLWFHEPGPIKTLVALPMLIVAFLSSAWMSSYLGPLPEGAPPRFSLERACVYIAIFLIVLQMVISIVGGLKQGFLDTERKGSFRAIVMLLLFHILTSSIGAGVLYLSLKALRGESKVGDGMWHVLVWGVPLFLSIITLVVILQLGMLGRNFPDERREWWSRLGATLALFVIGWVVLFSTAIYGPRVVLWLRATLQDAWASGLLLGWAGTVAAGLFASNNAGGGGPEESNRGGIRPFLVKLAPPVFILGIFLLLSMALHRVTLEFVVYPEPVRALYCPGNPPECVATPSPAVLAQNHFAILSQFSSRLALLWALGLFAASWMLAWRVDINEFSLHQFYRNRLVRCYLGASRRRRRPNLFTGFDPDDSIGLTDLDPVKGYSGPYAIFNTALNLVHGENLAWQERKAESFVFTPAYCGYDTANNRATHPADRPHLEQSAYRETEKYSERGGPHTGMAVAISGAAASPNSGYHSNPAAAFLMTVFDVRLGWWIGNPRHKEGYSESSPRSGLLYLIFELMGLTNDRRGYVYLSDGGHFENLALYELIRRRCRYIIACDAEQDRAFQFQGLGNAIRRCRTDFQVEINIDIDRLRPSGDSQFSGAHCVVATILYPEKDAEGRRLTGTLLYIKSSLTGDEPADLLEHRRQDPTFPHTSTADQWFSESQFESYRRLGLHVANTVFRDVAEDVPVAWNREEFFRRLRQQWYPPAPTKHRFTEHSRALTELLERLRQDPNLRFLHGQISPEWPVLMSQASDPPKIQRWLPHTERELRAGFMFCNSIIQLMENVYLDLDLESQWNHPDHRGWMNVFNNWVWSSMFRVTWAVSAACYGARFQSFCQKRLHLPLGRLSVAACSPDELNDFERWNRWDRVKQEGDRLWSLEMLVDNPAVGSQRMAFRFGFAVVDSEGYLAFYRVQNHLRKMGLWSNVEPMLRREARIQGDRLRRPVNPSI